VIGTRATINSGIYERKIKEQNPDARVFSAACPLLVPLVEEGWLKKPETRMIVKKYLHPLKTRQIDTLILGCTHYPMLESIIQQKIGKRVRVISSSIAVAEQVRSFLSASPAIDQELSKNGKSEFFVSDLTPQFEKTAKFVIRQPINLKHVRI
jgi:glutamate racemase